MAYVPLLVSVYCTGSKLAKFKSLFFRFAPFVKMGGENFLLGRLGNVKVNEQDIIEVVVSNSSICNTISQQITFLTYDAQDRLVHLAFTFVFSLTFSKL